MKTHTYSLGAVHGVKTYCRITEVFSGGNEQGTEQITLQFLSRLHGHQVSKSVRSIVGFPNDTEIQVEDFIHAGHKQVFVSAVMGRVDTHLYDFDGHTVSSIYDREDGRVGVKPVRVRRRGWILQESWGRIPFRDEFDLGVGFDKGNNGVVRDLHWNGKKFVLDRPGPTRILDGNGHEEIRPKPK